MDGQADVFGNLPQKDGRNITARMEGYGCASTIGMTELLMRPTLANFDETQGGEKDGHFMRL